MARLMKGAILIDSRDRTLRLHRAYRVLASLRGRLEDGRVGRVYRVQVVDREHFDELKTLEEKILTSNEVEPMVVQPAHGTALMLWDQRLGLYRCDCGEMAGECPQCAAPTYCGLKKCDECGCNFETYMHGTKQPR